MQFSTIQASVVRISAGSDVSVVGCSVVVVDLAVSDHKRN